jgi:adenylylsulfate kinase
MPACSIGLLDFPGLIVKLICEGSEVTVYCPNTRMTAKNKHTVLHKGCVTKVERNRLCGHDSGVIWFTGLSASGKSTIAHTLEKRLHQEDIRAYVLDGDNIRHGLNANLGFSAEDRTENIRRIVEVAGLFVDAGIVVIAAFITPFESQRTFIKNRLRDVKLIEVYVKCPIGECIRRDPKGLYEKARTGVIQNYTGVSPPFEEPEASDLVLDTEKMSIDESVSAVLAYLEETGFLKPKKV